MSGIILKPLAVRTCPYFFCEGVHFWTVEADGQSYPYSSNSCFSGWSRKSNFVRRLQVFPRRWATDMKSPYGLSILDDGTTCPVWEQHFFCNLSPLLVQRLNAITCPAIYPRAAVLFLEGQEGRGTLCPLHRKSYF